ncbi:MAG: hypothetical protein EXQ92_09570 [Alphaproteobacteria bacterium]|nr:hypothetical protein [Alphaproteobacteria bacterium]
MNLDAYSIAAAPLLPWWALWALAVAIAAIVALGAWRRARGTAWRALASVILWLVLVNPSLIEEQREARPDVAVVVVDDSPSQRIGQRRLDADKALAHIEKQLGQMRDLETRVIRVGGSALGTGLARGTGTELFHALDRALADVPRQRLGGVVMITDGQVHDAPAEGAYRRGGDQVGPVHALITGQKNEGDRRLVVVQAPSYGMVGRKLSMTVRIDDPAGTGTAGLVMRVDGGDSRRVPVPIGRDHEIPFTLDHGGQTVIELTVDPGPVELTLDNNRAVIAINGVRDRLRVLLVSGEPHPGERTWRNLLKADPSVDLVHFTILRPPEKQDGTPIRELSLIAFPIRELFEIKLEEFNLVIFDHYRQRGVLPRNYLGNIADYVNNGGALLEAAGPAFATSLSLYRSPLSAVLPGEPTGVVIERPFKADLTELGRRHPVTTALPGSTAAGSGFEPGWGRWFRLIDATPRKGHVVMAGVEQRPVLILDRVGKGRVAQLLSDQIWLWSRGYEGGGPQAELLRRLAHWLMKEPELEENDLHAVVQGDKIEIVRRTLEPTSALVTVTLPSGDTVTVELGAEQNGRQSAVLPVEDPGLYHLTDGVRSALAAVGALNPAELADVRATERVLRPAVDASGGALAWVADGNLPELRRTRPGRQTKGRDWFGIVAHGDHVVTGVKETTLMPGLLVLGLALGTLIAAWRREGK